MPRIVEFAGARISQGLELKTGGCEADGRAVLEQALSVGRDQVCHGSPLPSVPVEPQPSIHGMDHSFTPRFEFSIRNPHAGR